MPIFPADVLSYCLSKSETLVEMGMFLGVNHTPSQGTGPSYPKFWDPYLYPHRLT